MISKPFEDKVDCKFGAPMGRRSDIDLFGKVHLQHVKFYDGCYDKGGAYWGSPENLYCAWNDENTFYLRANSREHAKQLILHMFDDVKFYR
jgi:hypothetical protein